MKTEKLNKNYENFPETKAMEMNKIIICMRSEKLWNEALLSISGNKKTLYNYKDYTGKGVIFLKNKRQPYLTTGNMKAEEFERIKKALKSNIL